jgi:hypothetical protein
MRCEVPDPILEGGGDNRLSLPIASHVINAQIRGRLHEISVCYSSQTQYSAGTAALHEHVLRVTQLLLPIGEEVS